jgi:Ala-tRNA(Pro) deacylase
LFLCDKKARRFFLVVTACEKTVKLDALSSELEVSHLRFGSEENLMRLLGVTRGAVTMMGLVHDKEHQVELWIDAEIWGEESFLSHPLVNTATLILAKSELERFFALTGHTVHFFEGV